MALWMLYNYTLYYWIDITDALICTIAVGQEGANFIFFL